MNILFSVIVVLSLVFICISNPESAVGFLLEGTSEAVRLTLKLIAIYSLWTGVLKLMENIKLDKKLNRILSPLTKRLFKEESEEARALIGLNLTANFLGMGGAATSTGIKAITVMDKGSATASKGMLMFFIINVSSVQLIPATVIAMRSAAGSTAPSDIFLPSLLATLATTLAGIGGALLCEKIKARIKGLRGQKSGKKSLVKKGRGLKKEDKKV